MTTDYDKALRLLERAEAEADAGLAQELFAMAHVRATLATAAQLSEITDELSRIRGELHELRKAARLARV